MKFGFDWPSGFRERCGRRMTDGRDGRRSMGIVYAHLVSLKAQMS